MIYSYYSTLQLNTTESATVLHHNSKLRGLSPNILLASSDFNGTSLCLVKMLSKGAAWQEEREEAFKACRIYLVEILRNEQPRERNRQEAARCWV